MRSIRIITRDMKYPDFKKKGGFSYNFDVEFGKKLYGIEKKKTGGPKTTRDEVGGTEYYTTSEGKRVRATSKRKEKVAKIRDRAEGRRRRVHERGEKRGREVVGTRRINTGAGNPRTLSQPRATVKVYKGEQKRTDKGDDRAQKYIDRQRKKQGRTPIRDVGSAIKRGVRKVVKKVGKMSLPSLRRNRSKINFSEGAKGMKKSFGDKCRTKKCKRNARSGRSGHWAN